MSNEELWKKVTTEGTIDPQGHLEAMNKMIKFMAEQGMKPAELKNWTPINSNSTPLGSSQGGFSFALLSAYWAQQFSIDQEIMSDFNVLMLGKLRNSNIPSHA